MNKLASLRTAYAAMLPRLAREPERLLVFADKGRVLFTASDSKSWLYEYRATLIFLDFPLKEESYDTLFLTLINWLKDNNEWELLQAFQAGKRDGVGFEADLLDSDSADVQLTIDLTERVKVTDAPGGGWITEHLAEPKLADQLLDDWTGGPLVSVSTAADGPLIP